MNAVETLKSLLLQAVKDTGRQLQTDAHDVAVYAAQRADHLATIATDPDFNQALLAERDAIALKAGVSAVSNADAADQRIVGLIHGALGVLVAALA